MNSLTDFLSGLKIIEEVESPINGELTVVKDLTWGTYIKAGGLTQSGGVAEDVWKTTLRRIHDSGFMVCESLIIGLGAGSIAKLIHEYWPASTRGEPKAKITGIDIDPIIVDLGKKYLGLNEKKVKIIIGDAYKLITHYSLPITHYDLICVDTYLGDEYPKKFENEKFLKATKSLLNKNGLVIFNRLYYDEKRPLAHEFEKKLEKVFSKVERIYPEANVMFVCSS
jgi:SAM-dependent methyltransferase